MSNLSAWGLVSEVRIRIRTTRGIMGRVNDIMDTPCLYTYLVIENTRHNITTHSTSSNHTAATETAAATGIRTSNLVTATKKWAQGKGHGCGKSNHTLLILTKCLLVFLPCAESSFLFLPEVELGDGGMHACMQNTVLSLSYISISIRIFFH